MSMTTNKQALSSISKNIRHWSSMVALTSDRISCLSVEQLDGIAEALEAAERRNAELAHHLKSAHQFIEHTEAFGYMAASGILQCGDAKWDVDASKESLRAAATDKGE